MRAVPIACDLADPAARAALPTRVAELGLRVEVLANVAGLGTYGEFVAADPGRQLEQVQVMSAAVVELCGAFAPAMAARRRGAILIVSSAIGLMPMARYATYGATRSFCVAFGGALHAELRHRGVAVSTVCPGGVRSEFFAANGPQPVQRLLPGPFWRTPDQVAEASIGALRRNRRVLVPGAAMRALVAAGSLMPAGARLLLSERALRAAEH